MTTKQLVDTLRVIYAQLDEGQAMTIRTKSGAHITITAGAYSDNIDDVISEQGPFVVLYETGCTFLVPGQVESIYI